MSIEIAIQNSDKVGRDRNARDTENALEGPLKIIPLHCKPVRSSVSAALAPAVRAVSRWPCQARARFHVEPSHEFLPSSSSSARVSRLLVYVARVSDRLFVFLASYP
jgi:hypothetical protein